MNSRFMIAFISCLWSGICLAQTPLPCTPPGRNDTHPWDYKLKVLSSFPWDSPHPRFFGAFRDKSLDYELVLYQDAKGFFGQLHSPVLEADSPTSRLYSVNFDPKRSALKFEARFRDGGLSFSGSLRGRIIRGVVTRNDRTERVSLRRLRGYELTWSYRSRAQFDCSMTLNRRY